MGVGCKSRTLVTADALSIDKPWLRYQVSGVSNKEDLESCKSCVGYTLNAFVC